MKRKLAIMTLTAALSAALFVLPGCTTQKTPNDQKAVPPTPPNQQQPTQPTQPANPNEGKTEFHPSIGGITLGESLDKVEQLLGKDYKETSAEEMGHFPEVWVKRDYNQGISIIYGKDSKKLFEIDTTNSDYKTDLGVKVGDKATEAFNTYGAKYKQFESKQGEGKLNGFYELGDGELIIFDLNKEDGSILNDNVGSDSKVESMRLTRSEYLD